MYDVDPNWCLTCGYPFTPTEEIHETSGIGDQFTDWVTCVNDEVCQCAVEDDDD
ncbi:hypothetical protein [Pseudomonas sp. Leaf127]|uniref:hypothetical protein n=1 Tax=Pseudomonas sp. Leaf127 TaxID=1736267 RepID=UPI000B2D0A43|nr:hypothetical protein [Pseudomonas sp. Leaf127]